jgi:hypothetical protein
MATKLEEKKAFDKLCKSFPNEYCTLDFEMKRYSSGENNTTYKAYVSHNNETYLSINHKLPIEAVEEVLNHFGRR